ncbi:MAG: GAF domain-containing protein [Anaerolineales bacterium]|nr:GAF domain-containing protein [Anaerolineales bacterium]
MRRPTSFRWTLGYRIGTGVILFLLFPLAAVLVGINTRATSLNRAAESTTETVVQLKEAELEAAVSELERNVENIVMGGSNVAVFQQALDAPLGTLDTDTIDAVLQNILTRERSIHHVRLYNPTIFQVVWQRGPESNNLPAWMISRINSSTTSRIGQLYEGRRGDPLIDVIVPIRDTTNTTILGYVIVTQNLNLTGADNLPDLRAIFETQPRFIDLPEAYIGLFNYSGTLLISSQRGVETFEDYAQHPAVRGLRTGTSEAVEATRYNSPLLDEAVISSSIAMPSTQWIVVVEIPRSQILPSIFTGFLPMMIGGLGLVVILSVVWGGSLYRFIHHPLQQLVREVSFFSLEDRTRPLDAADRTDEFGVLHNAFAQLTQQIYGIIDDNRLTIEKQTEQFDLIRAIASLSRTVPTPDDFLRELVRVLREKLSGADYVQFFYVHEDIAEIRVGSGDLGRRLVSQSYHQPLTADNIIGRAVLTKQPILVLDLAQQPRNRQIELLSEMASEIVVPIISGDKVIGVLDTLSTLPHSFNQVDVETLTIIANQMVVGLQRQSTVEVATAPVLTASVRGYVSEWSELQRQAMHTRVLAESHNNGKVKFAVPVLLRNEVLGAVEFVVDETRYNPNTIQTAQELVERLALAIDNATLFEQSQRLVERERLVNQITEKLTSQTDVRQILQIAVRELGLALGAPETQISLKVPKQGLGSL